MAISAQRTGRADGRAKTFCVKEKREPLDAFGNLERRQVQHAVQLEVKPESQPATLGGYRSTSICNAWGSEAIPRVLPAVVGLLLLRLMLGPSRGLSFRSFFEVIQCVLEVFLH